MEYNNNIAGRDTSLPAEATTAREPETSVVIKRLEQSATSLHATIERLEKRVEIVSRIEPERVEENEVKEQEFNSTLAQLINNTARALSYQEARLSKIISRLEI